MYIDPEFLHPLWVKLVLSIVGIFGMGKFVLFAKRWMWLEEILFILILIGFAGIFVWGFFHAM